MRHLRGWQQRLEYALLRFAFASAQSAAGGVAASLNPFRQRHH